MKFIENYITKRYDSKNAKYPDVVEEWPSMVDAIDYAEAMENKGYFIKIEDPFKSNSNTVYKTPGLSVKESLISDRQEIIDRNGNDFTYAVGEVIKSVSNLASWFIVTTKSGDQWYFPKEWDDEDVFDELGNEIGVARPGTKIVSVQIVKGYISIKLSSGFEWSLL